MVNSSALALVFFLGACWWPLGATKILELSKLLGAQDLPFLNGILKKLVLKLWETGRAMSLVREAFNFLISIQ